jgi:hypothetical protein
MSKIGNTQYRVRFDHNRQPTFIMLSDIHGNNYRVENKEKSTTTCHLEEFGEKKPTFTATTRLFTGNWEQEKDYYNKETGRRASLTLALVNLEVDERTIIWDSYLNRKKNAEANLVRKKGIAVQEELLAD